MLRPSQSCSITPFWGECKSSSGSPKLSIHVAPLTLGAQGFRSQQPHKSRLQIESPVSLRKKSKAHGRATRHLCRSFRERTRGSRLMTLQCDFRIRCRISSRRSGSDIPSRPNLEALEAPRSGIATFAPLEVRLTMRTGLLASSKPIGPAVLPTHRHRRGLSRIAPFQLLPRRLAPSRRKLSPLVETFSMSLLAVSQSTLETPYFLPLCGQATPRESSGFRRRSCSAFLQKLCVELRTDQN